jgi:acetolactate synthase I/II/III large subunit
MNGAESIVRTLSEGGVEVCFANPGTSEIHLVAALDHVKGIRGVPCLFEGVAVGAADGYARMTAKPACSLLHLGPGFANGLANLHNASRAHVPILNLIGDHATYHRKYDAPLTADIEALARTYCRWLRTSAAAKEAGQDCADAIANTHAAPGSISTLIVPADVAWTDGGQTGKLSTPPATPLPNMASIEGAAALLKNDQQSAILLGDRAAQGDALIAAGRIAAATGAKLFVPFSFSRVERGAGLPAVERIAYVVDQAVSQLHEFRQLILVGARQPVAFFASPSTPSVVTPANCNIFTLARSDNNCVAALEALAASLSASRVAFRPVEKGRPGIPGGDITLSGLAAVVGALLPPHAIVVDESITSGRGMMAAARGAAPHDWLVNTGGSIGIGMPLSVGASIACHDRPVLCLSGDGSLMYTLQSLWTAAREGLNITLVVFANRSYSILKGELSRLGQDSGRSALDLLDIDRPDLDFVALAKGMGVPGRRVSTLEEFAAALQSGFDSAAPNLIEVPL